MEVTASVFDPVSLARASNSHISHGSPLGFPSGGFHFDVFPVDGVLQAPEGQPPYGYGWAAGVHESGRSTWEAEIFDDAAGVPGVWITVRVLWNLAAGEWSHAFEFHGKRISVRFRPIGA